MKKLKEIRIKKNLTQSDIAKKIGVSTNTYSRYERGERQPNIDILKKISKYLDISVDYLIGNIDIPLTLDHDDFNKEIDILSDFEIFSKYDFVFDGKPVDKEVAKKIIELIKSLVNK